jgi:hypothetical protein
MAGVIENCSKSEVIAVVRFLQAEGMGASEIQRRSVSVYGQNVSSREKVSVWCKQFKYGRKTQKHRRKQRSSHIVENCVIVEGLIRED